MPSDATTKSLPPIATAFRWPALAIGVVAAALCVPALLSPGTMFFRAYLFAWLFYLGISLGCLGLAMVHNLTGGAWALPIRRAMDAASLTIPLLAILFIPILLGIHQLYAWSNGADAELIQHRRILLNVPFFIFRAVAYLATWSVLSIGLWRLSHKWRLRQDLRAADWLRRLSAAGLILYLLTGTHAAIDWIMSREIRFYSTMFGFIFISGQAVVAMAFLVLCAWKFTDRSMDRTTPGIPEPSTHHPEIPVDLGKMLHMLVILWAYIAFFQFLVIWMGNIQEDNGWYIARGLGPPNSWTSIIVAIAIFHFFVPFFLLLFRSIKSRMSLTGPIAVMILLAHLGYQYWLIAPVNPAGHLRFAVHWTDLVTPIAIGGLWLFVFLTIFLRNPIQVLSLPDIPPQSEVAHG